MLQCYNRGCGQTYDPENNTDESCRHHPGAPYFHDAYKGWSCCKKKSVDFTEFLNIKGCTLSKHSNIKPPEPEKPAEKENGIDKHELPVIREPIKEPLKRPPLDSPMITLTPTVAPVLKEAIDSLKANVTGNANINLEARGDVVVGTACKNSGCSYSFTGTISDNDNCAYHPGVPIFHEGMKYWSCCQRKTTDFAGFMAQKGCVDGVHKWFKDENRKGVQCRYDWHQTACNVIVSIYAKMYHYKLSTIAVNPIRLKVELLFPGQDNAKFNLDLELRGIILANKATVQMFGTKVEIILPKAEPGTWPKLEFAKTKVSSQNTPLKANSDDQNHDSENDVDLEDIEPVTPSFYLSECAQKK